MARTPTRKPAQHCSQNALARLLHVSEGTIVQWRLAGLPYIERGGNGRPYKYSVDQAREWRDAHRRQGQSELKNLRNRLIDLRVQKLQLEIGLKIGSYFNKADVERELDRVCSLVQRRIEALPNRCAPLVIGMNAEEIRALLDAEVAEVLAPLKDFRMPAPPGKRMVLHKTIN
jgi:hypothetical protein